MDRNVSKTAEDRLHHCEEQLRCVLDHRFTFVGVLTLDGTLIEAHYAPYDTTSRSASKAIGKKFWDCPWWNFSPQLKTRLREAIEHAAHNETLRYDVVVQMADHTRRWMDFQLAPMPDSEGHITHLISSAMDITERKRAEEALRQSEAEFRSLFELSAVGSVQADPATGRLLCVNRRFCEITGYSESDLLARTYTDLTHPDDRERDLHLVEPVLRGEADAWEIETRYVKADGTVVWVHLTGRLLFDTDGRPYRSLASLIDITARKRAEEALRASERRASLLARLGDATRTLSDPREIVLTAMRVLREHLGADRCAWAEVEADEDHFTFLGADVAPGVAGVTGRFPVSAFGAEALRVMREGRPFVCADALAELPEGADREAYRRIGIRALIATPLHKGGRFVAGTGVHALSPRVWTPEEVELVREVTERCWESIERARAERARVERAQIEVVLRTRIEEVEALLDLIPAAIWITRDADCRHIHGNRTASELYRLPQQANLSQTAPPGQTALRIPVFRHGRALAPEELPMQRAAATGQPQMETDLEAELPDGRRVAWVGGAVPVLNDQGEVEGVVASFMDITERKRVEAALRESEERFRTLAVATSQIIWICDAEGWFVEDSPSWRAFTGQTSEQCQGWGWLEAIHPDDREWTRQAWQRAVAGKTHHHIENRLRTAEGSYRWMSVRAVPVLDADGRIREWVGTNTDITERKTREQQLAEQARLLDLCHDAILVRDAQDRITYWNQGAVATYGYTREEALGKVSHELLRAESPAPLESLRKTLQRDLHWSGELIHTRRDGGRLTVDSHWALDQHMPGGPASVLEINIDITERQAAEEKRRESEARFRTLADHVPVLIWILGSAGCEFVNRSYLDFLGVSLQDVQGRGWVEFVHPDDYESYVGRFLIMSEQRAMFESELRFRRADGVYRRMKTVAVPRFSPAGDFLGYVGCTYDITEIKEAEETLREADRRKDEFLATLAHELRNPLAPIRNALQILKLRSPSDPTLQAARDMIERQLHHMVRLIDDLLDVSRITRGKLQLRKERVELAAVVDQALETSRPHAEQAGHTLTVRLPPQLIYLDADPVRLAQIFSNLLNNACKYTEKGGHIALTADRDGTDVIVRIKDTGIGIPPEHLPHLFEMFTQVTSALERSHGGLGIGLSLARGLVAMHGGRIEAHSDGLGQGSEFVVRMPGLTETRSPPSPHLENQEAHPSLPTCRILVVDDNRDSTESLALLLRLNGHDVETAYDGVEGVAAAESHRPEVILLDIGMPKMNGYEACRAIRDQPWGKDIILVALTGWGQDEDRRKTKEAGFDGHLVKPVDPDALMELLAVSLLERGG